MDFATMRCAAPCINARPRLSGTTGRGLLQSNDPAGQEKAIIYNKLVANAVALQHVVDQTQALYTLKSEGVAIEPADLPYLSPETSNQ
jgi:hypothetical protein